MQFKKCIFSTTMACGNKNQPSNYGEGRVLQQGTGRYNFILGTFCLSFIACLHLTHFFYLNFKCIFSITVACRHNNQRSNYGEVRVVATENWAIRFIFFQGNFDRSLSVHIKYNLPSSTQIKNIPFGGKNVQFDVDCMVN